MIKDKLYTMKEINKLRLNLPIEEERYSYDPQVKRIWQKTEYKTASDKVLYKCENIGYKRGIMAKSSGKIIFRKII